jgi:hypothetical protein
MEGRIGDVGKIKQPHEEHLQFISPNGSNYFNDAWLA